MRDDQSTLAGNCIASFFVGTSDVNYHIIVKDGGGPLLTPLPIAHLVKKLLERRQSICSSILVYMFLVH
jgi:hypothetical protein